jgi:hypothetical protein
MRPLYWWLVVYFVLIAGAGLSLWQAGVFSHLGWLATLTLFVVCIGLGALLYAAGQRPAVPSE